MGFRFRRSIKLVPGVRFNFSSGGVSASFGGKGFRTTIGTSGKRTTVSLPGTGLSYSVQSRRNKKTKKQPADANTAEALALAEPPLATLQSHGNWYVHLNEEARGPFTAEVLYQALAQGTLSNQDWVWRKGLADWIRISNEPTFAAPIQKLRTAPIQKVNAGRWNVRKAFLVTLALTVVAATINYKSVLDHWAILSTPDFLASMCGRLLGLPIIIVVIAGVRNFYQR